MKNPYPKELTERLAKQLRTLLDDTNAGNNETKETSRWPDAEKACQDFENHKK
jgi:hypothetical protein